MAALELNVKQSGIVNRIITTTYFKTRAGKINKRASERYLRDDLPCGLKTCEACRKYGKGKLSKKNASVNTLVSSNHAIVADASTWMRFADIFESELFSNVLITQGVWEHVKAKSVSAYKKLNALTYELSSDRFTVFMSEFHHEIYVPPEHCVSETERQEKSLLTTAKYLTRHWAKNAADWLPVLLTAEEGERDRLRVAGVSYAYTVKEYVSAFSDASRQELLNKMAAYEASAIGEKLVYEEHLTHDLIMQGIATGKLRRGTFSVSRENYREATVIVDEELNTWFITGVHCNRAVHGDIVAVELLPKSEWTAPEKTIRLRDVEEMTKTADAIVDEQVETDEEAEMEEGGEGVEELGEPRPKKAKRSIAVPTAKVVGIIKRNWRPYCGILMPSALKGARRHLFCPAERVIPRIRIETEQAEILAHQRIVVCIDHWPRDSKYPLGHYVKTIGQLGDRDTENEVLLLEHDVPHAPFSDAVMDCLPPEDWRPDMSNVVTMQQWRENMTNVRVDLREFNICSVDPLGCTDIDDALHCRQLANGHLEVGVHIADVTHFLRPGTAMDEEASQRSTTVYLCDRRIDMLPVLLSSNLCSLRGNEERYAFSVIWEMTEEAEVLSTRFHKSLIRSKAALTYERAQQIIDDKDMQDELAASLRRLNALSKLRKAKRTADGALTLASSEIRFEMDWETKTPKGVQSKEHLDTHSMVEEFMLLANISVAEKIFAEYPDCALLRRHPVPAPVSYKPVIEAAKKRGYELSIESGKALADSLNRAVDHGNPMVNRLLRMLTTRCMTQALYFSAGTVPVESYMHFGLATPIYTHFTSPIRRYADVVVHRLLAASIGADEITAGLLSQANVKKLSLNMNYRHKQAQYAGRASVQLNVLTFFKGRIELAEGFIMGVRSNGIQIFVPTYGIESVIVIQPSVDTVIDAEGGCVRAGATTINELDRVRVQIRLDETNVQRPRIRLELVEPRIQGLSVDFDLSTEQGIGK